MWKCDNCGSENIRFMTSLIFAAHNEYLHNISKTTFRKKEVELWGVMWEDSLSIYCTDCGKNLVDIHPEMEKFNKLKEELEKAKGADWLEEEEDYGYYQGMKRAYEVMYGEENG